MHILIPLFASFFIIGLAELGDKTMLLVITLASKFPMDKVIYGVAASTATLMLIAVLIGEAVQRLIPPLLIGVLAGGFFIIYGLNQILPVKEKDENEKEAKPVKTKSAFWTVYASLFMAELGDKTQLATFAIAAKYSAPFLVWSGATLGMITVDLFGILIGNILRNYIPEEKMKYLSGVVFIVFGVITFLGMVLKV
jgi:Ca2+/H+ antiporter, TMEM165/GDT1 family